MTYDVDLFMLIQLYTHIVPYLGYISEVILNSKI